MFDYGNTTLTRNKCGFRTNLKLKVQAKLKEEYNKPGKSFDKGYKSFSISNQLQNVEPKSQDFKWEKAGTQLKLVYLGNKNLRDCFIITNPQVQIKDGKFIFSKNEYCNGQPSFYAYIRNEYGNRRGGVEEKVFNFQYKLSHDPETHTISLTNLDVRENCEEIQETLYCRPEDQPASKSTPQPTIVKTITFKKENSFSINGSFFLNHTCWLSRRKYSEIHIR